MREQREEILWDLHQETMEQGIVPSYITNEINPEEFGLKPLEAQEMTQGLQTSITEREALKDAYSDVVRLEITAENLPTFKELRLKIVKNRTQGIEKWHKTNKAFYLAGGRFVDAIKNKEIIVNEQMEAKLMDAEKFFENQEKEAKRLLNEKRLERISPYVIEVFGLDFSDMNDYDFDDYVLGKKTRFENEQKERKAELLIIENERLAEIERQKAIELENVKLKAEAEAKEIELQKERAKVEAERKIEAEKQSAIQDEKDAELEAERKEKQRLRDEINTKAKAENEAELERLAELARQTKANELAAKAPVKKQLTIWVNKFEIPLPAVANEKTLLIAQKFNAFKEWAKKEIETI